jgi:hypothetical protein
MRRVCLITVATCLALPTSARAQFGDPVGVHDFRNMLKEQSDLNSIHEGLVQYGADTRKYTEEMAELRKRFWSEYPNGPRVAEVAREFNEKLWIKDLAFLIVGALPEGTRTVRSALVTRLLSLLDGGIPPTARLRFNVWATAVRERLGATGDKPLYFPNPLRVLEAIAATEAQYEQYRIDRDFAEFDAAGREPAWITDTPSYVASLYFRYGRLDIEAARREYDAAVSIFGESHVSRLADRVRKAPKKEGLLTSVEPLGLVMAAPGMTRTAEELRRAKKPLPGNVGLVGGHSPLQAFHTLLGAGAEDPKVFLLAHIDKDAHDGGWQGVLREYGRWADAYGEAAVLAAATAVLKAPRFLDGTVQDPADPDTDYMNPFMAFEMVVSRTNNPAAFVRAAIAFERGADTPARRTARYAELSAVRGEAALLEAARHAVALHASDARDRSREQNRMLGRLRLRGGKAAEALLELAAGTAPATPITTSSLAPNPIYQAWASFEPGASVTMDTTVKSLTPAPVGGNRPGQAAAPIERTVSNHADRRRLDSVTETAATVEWSSANTTRQSPLDKVLTLPARVRPEEADDAFFAAEVPGDRVPTIETTGQESCAAGGSSVPCRWVRRVYPGLRDGQEVVTLWFSDLVPGGIARALKESLPPPGRPQIVSDSRVTSFSGRRRADEPPVAGIPAGTAAPSPPLSAADRATVRERPPAAVRPPTGSALTAVPSGTVLVLKLLNGVDARTRSGAFVRAALQEPLLVDGKEAAAAGTIFVFRYRIAADRRDRRQLAYELEPHSLEIGARRVPVASVTPGAATPSLEGRGQDFLVLPAGTVLTVAVR